MTAGVVLLAAMQQATLTGVVRDSIDLEADDPGYFLQPVEGAGADTVCVPYRDRPARFSLRLLGLGWQYTNFVAQAGNFPVPRPWPSFGIEGDGVYGYFAGAAASRTVHVYSARVADAAGDRFTPPKPHVSAGENP